MNEFYTALALTAFTLIGGAALMTHYAPQIYRLMHREKPGHKHAKS